MVLAMAGVRHFAVEDRIFGLDPPSPSLLGSSMEMRTQWAFWTWPVQQDRRTQARS
jgi:hypothetical protein